MYFYVAPDGTFAFMNITLWVCVYMKQTKPPNQPVCMSKAILWSQHFHYLYLYTYWRVTFTVFILVIKNYFTFRICGWPIKKKKKKSFGIPNVNITKIFIMKPGAYICGKKKKSFFYLSFSWRTLICLKQTNENKSILLAKLNFFRQFSLLKCRHIFTSGKFHFYLQQEKLR